jgi:hypothetical protein
MAPILLLIGLWIVATTMVGLAFPGNVPVGFLFGAAFGAPIFFPMVRYARKRAAADMFVHDRWAEKALGGPEQLAEHRRRSAARLGLDDPVRAATAQRVLAQLRWAPAGICAFLSVFGVLAAMTQARREGVSATVMAVCAGVGAVFALLLWLWARKYVPETTNSRNSQYVPEPRDARPRAGSGQHQA